MQTVTTIPHRGDTCPVPADTTVLIDLGDGQRHVERAGSCAWGAGLGPDGAGRILAYAVLLPADADGEPVAAL